MAPSPGNFPVEILVTGLMSGSSLDGVDLACCGFLLEAKKWKYRIIEAETLPYPPALREKLAQGHLMDPARRSEADLELGLHFGTLLNDFHRRKNLSPAMISSHGHTLLHDPERRITFQAGSGEIMVRTTGIMVINDFRREDVEAGGQGAPLVPIGDRLLFGDFEACVNLGGFANISYENPAGERIAFDTGPANLALNYAAGLAGLDFDKNGELAASGNPDTDLLQSLDQLEFFHLPPPKSLGKEWFYSTYSELLSRHNLNAANMSATLSLQVAGHLASAINVSGATKVLLTGGGALNRTLVRNIRKLSQAEVVVPAPELIQYKEALVFALLGLLRYRDEINCLASATGGPEDLSAGFIHLPACLRRLPSGIKKRKGQPGG